MYAFSVLYTIGHELSNDNYMFSNTHESTDYALSSKKSKSHTSSSSTSASSPLEAPPLPPRTYAIHKPEYYMTKPKLPRPRSSPLKSEPPRQKAPQLSQSRKTISKRGRSLRTPLKSPLREPPRQLPSPLGHSSKSTLQSPFRAAPLHLPPIREPATASFVQPPRLPPKNIGRSSSAFISNPLPGDPMRQEPPWQKSHQRLTKTSPSLTNEFQAIESQNKVPKTSLPAKSPFRSPFPARLDKGKKQQQKTFTLVLQTEVHRNVNTCA